MTWSANEVMTLAAKAARGAGAPPAQASEFGRAVVCHAHAGREFSFISNALDAMPGGPIMELPIAFMRMLERESVINANGCLPLAQSYAEALPYAAQVDVIGETLHIKSDLQTPSEKVSLGRFVLPDDLITKMTTLAVRILVPESDASRRAGAGAGLTDND